MLQLGRRMGARLFFGTPTGRGYGELTFPCLKADPPNRSDSRLLGKTPPFQPFRAGGTAPRPGLGKIGVPLSEGRSADPQRPGALGENAAIPAISRRGHRLAYSNL